MKKRTSMKGGRVGRVNAGVGERKVERRKAGGRREEEDGREREGSAGWGISIRGRKACAC